MNRRTYLAGFTSGLVLLAGCSSENNQSRGQGGDGAAEGAGDDRAVGEARARLTAVLDMTQVSDTDIAREITYQASTDRTRKLFKGVIEDGSVTVEGTEPPALSSERVGPWLYEDTVYRLSNEVTGEEASWRFTVKINPVEGSVSDEETIAFDELPEVDREKLATVGFAEVGPDQIIGIGTTFVYTEAERNESALVPSPVRSVIVWESGRRARITVEEGRKTSVKSYTYTVDEIGTAEQHGRKFREQYEFELTGLSSGEREIIDIAITTKGYRVFPLGDEPEATPPSDLRTLVERFRGHPRFGVRRHHRTPKGRTHHRFEATLGSGCAVMLSRDPGYPGNTSFGMKVSPIGLNCVSMRTSLHQIQRQIR